MSRCGRLLESQAAPQASDNQRPNYADEVDHQRIPRWLPRLRTTAVDRDAYDDNQRAEEERRHQRRRRRKPHPRAIHRPSLQQTRRKACNQQATALQRSGARLRISATPPGPAPRPPLPCRSSRLLPSPGSPPPRLRECGPLQASWPDVITRSIDDCSERDRVGSQ